MVEEHLRDKDTLLQWISEYDEGQTPDWWVDDRPVPDVMLPAGASAWAVAAGTELGRWYATTGSVPVPEEDARLRLYLVTSTYVACQPWVGPYFVEGNAYVYALTQTAVAACQSAAAQPQGQPRRGDLRLPAGDPFERIEVAAVRRVHPFSDEQLLAYDEETREYLEDNAVHDTRITAWAIATRERVGGYHRDLPAMYSKKHPEHVAFVDDLVAHGTARMLAARDRRLADHREHRVGPPPAPQRYGVSPEGAERLAAEWMRHLGAEGVAVTRVSKDGGIDVTSDRYVAQVKAWAGPVGAVDVRALAGVAALERHTPLFFATTGYTTDAVSFAERAGMALFILDPVEGTLTGASTAGIALRTAGPG